MDNNFLIPELNPITFYETTRANLPKYFSKFMDKYPFPERLYYWQQQDDYLQVWQVEDIIYLQFESSFDPIIVKLLDAYGQLITDFPALLKLPNKNYPGTYAFEVGISLATLATGCYFISIELGVAGPSQKVLISNCQYVSATPLDNTVCIEYFNSRFHKDVIFETGIQFQVRLYGYFGFLDKFRKDEAFRNQKFSPALLNSRSAKQYPLHLGQLPYSTSTKTQFPGLPDDIINLIDEILGCDNVMIDGKSFGIADGTKLEYTTADDTGAYPKRGMKVTVEEGNNRNSRLFGIDVDPEKKFVGAVNVEAKIFGDLANQGSSNTVPIYNVVQE